MIAPELRAWVEESAGGRVVGSRTLRGGVVSVAREVRLRLRAGRSISLVLRTFGEFDEHGRADIAGAIASEAATLQALKAVALPTPELVAFRADALLMTKLSGHANLAPPDLQSKLANMARALPILHEAKAALAPVGRRLPMSPRDYSWVRDPKLARAASTLVGTLPTRIQRVPCHGDYQHFNMLWSRGRMSGLLDWGQIWLGPPEVDVSHCRLNLAVLYSADVAEEFRQRYEAEAGRAVDAWHDVHRLGVYSDDWPRFIPFQVHGRAPVRSGMTGRVEELLRSALARG